MNEKNEEVIGWGTREGEFEDVTSTIKSVQEQFKNYFHACHCMLFAYDSQLIIEEYKPKATVLMQMRFDGHFGFPGGIVDDGESLTEGLNRELTEEIGNPGSDVWDITDENFVSSHVSHSKHLVVHFFIKEISFEQLKQIESSAVTAKDFGSEAMGLVRVPLYTMKDGFRGLPAFLSNNFIGNTKEQLIRGLELKGILSHDEINVALSAKPLYIADKP